MSEMLRFSYWVVPEGYEPSTGSAETGRSSPRPMSILAVTSRTNFGAFSGTAASRPCVLVAFAGTFTWWRWAIDSSTAAWFFVTISADFLPYVFVMAFLTASMATWRGSTPEIAKKQVCRTVLVRRPRPTARATSVASIVYRLMPRSMIFCCIVSGRASNTSSGPYELFSSSVVPGRAHSSTSTRSRIDQWWQPMKPAWVTRYGASIGFGPKRRCEIVREPDFFESYTK